MGDSPKTSGRGPVDSRVLQRGVPPGNASISCLFVWLGRKGDFDKTWDPSSFKGLSRYFNTWTTQGRATVAVVMLTGLVGLKVLHSQYKEKQQAQKEEEFIKKYWKEKL